MMPTMSFSFFDAAMAAAVPTLTLSFPYGLELLALVPIGFATGLFAVLIQARRADRHAPRKARLSPVPARV